MTRSEKIARLKTMLRQIATEAPLESLALERAAPPAGLEVLAAPGKPVGGADAAREGIQKVMTDREADVSDHELDALEAIVMKEGRPVVFIRNNRFDDLPNPWTHLNEAAVRQRLQALFTSIGRVDLPNSVQLPYGGTGFVVGPNLVMTNRHVAELFTDGLGSRGLLFRTGDAAIDFKREVDTPDDDRTAYLQVRDVPMIHPYWDMALLRVDGLTQDHLPLRLSVARPEDMTNRDVVAVGYPARDGRNDLSVQDRIFERRYDVKRLQPGKLRRRETIRSFESSVSAVTHDSSTLGGNSGSAVVDVATGEVVGLHFAGVYLKANYAVPTYELARDARVVDAGLNFAGRLPATHDWDGAWARVDGEQPRVSAPSDTQAARVDGETATWTIPIRVSVSLGIPALGPRAAAVLVAPAAAAASGGAPAAVEARMQVPVIYPDLESRQGYRPDFLDLPDGEEVPLPELTTTGRKVVAKLEDGSPELKYHRFSVVIHKKRRLALFTASNVDWRPASRQINGRKPSRRQLTELDDNAHEKWVTDPRIPDGQQLPDVFYTKGGGAFDKGHIVRRDDVAWGDTFEEMQKGNGDTYHTTNCSPQVAGFNRSASGEDNWGDLENLVQKETKAETVCVFAGPALDDADRVFRGRDERGPVSVQIPRKFWKVVVANGDDGPRAYGFVLEQDLSDVPLEVPLEFAVPQPWKRYMQSIADIEGMLHGWVKLTWLKEHDGIESEEGRRIGNQARAAGR
jgi:endonuclease G